MNEDSAHQSGWEIAEVVFGVPFLASLALHWIVPRPLAAGMLRLALIPLGIVAVMAGLRLIVLARRELARYGQPTDPGHPTGKLVQTGVFASSRNPLYLASVLIFFGLAVGLNVLWALVALLASIALCHAVLIVPEERYLAAKFGQEYQAYAASVQRWLGQKMKPSGRSKQLMDRDSGTERRRWPIDGKEMVYVPAGEFLYGEDGQQLSLPAYWIDRTPVTQAEFARFVAATGYVTTAETAGTGCANLRGHWEDIAGASWRNPGGPGAEFARFLDDPGDLAEHPVVQVSWEDAAAYARWAGKRLPSEQEWEKAARGTDGRAYPWGDQAPTPALCNFDRHAGRTTPVGSYSPQGDSPFGCADMSGNVWEWTASQEGESGRVLRGGGWSHPAEYVRLALRSIHDPEERYDTDGFRCVSP